VAASGRPVDPSDQDEANVTGSRVVDHLKFIDEERLHHEFGW
jgi:hypothetical protein